MMFNLREIALFLSCLLPLPHLIMRKFIIIPSSQNNLKFHNLEKQDHDLSQNIIIFNVERVILRSSSSNYFPYFMLVAFEAGSIIRAFILFVLYPIIRVLDNFYDLGFRVMVMICFLGLRQDRFRAIGRTVLPKFLLEDVGLEGFKVVRRGGKKVGVTDLPLVMVESFLKEYMEIDFVVGREIKVFGGYFLGILTENKRRLAVEMADRNKIIGIAGGYYNGGSRDHHHRFFSLCKEIYVVSEEEKKQWQPLSRDMYPRPLIFHDGRLAFRPAFLPMLVTFMWFPVGLFLSIHRICLGFIPYRIALPIAAFTGLRLRITIPKSNLPNNITEGKEYRRLRRLYVCNHKTLLDPVFLSVLVGTPLSTVTFSVSRVSEFLSPIKTVRLKRDRNEDAQILKNLLDKGDLVICPEGTTCREPYLLRFSPLFAELTTAPPSSSFGGGNSDDNVMIIPVAVDSCVSMFHGTTAGGMKCLDPFFFLMNPYPGYAFELLDISVSRRRTPAGGLLRSKFEVANMVQREIGKTLGFECTNLTRKDKYILLTNAG